MMTLQERANQVAELMVGKVDRATAFDPNIILIIVEALIAAVKALQDCINKPKFSLRDRLANPTFQDRVMVRKEILRWMGPRRRKLREAIQDAMFKHAEFCAGLENLDGEFQEALREVQ